MNVINELLANVPLIASLCAMLIAQALKIFYFWLFEHDLNWRHIFEVGGMPSSHSALVVCLSIMMGLMFGFNSAYFSISCVLSAIVMYDAIKVRPEEVAHTLLQVSTGAVFGLIVAVFSFLMFVK
jgi:uncharacterized protein